MNSDYRNRIILPVLMPILVLVGIVAVVGTMAAILLFTSKVLAITLAIVVATGIIVAAALANSIDAEDLTVRRRGAIAMTALVPFALAGGVALWSVNGGVPEEEWPINAEEAIVVPEGAVVAAQNDQSFCVFDDPEAQENCTDTQQVTLPAPEAEADPLRFLFVNLQSGIDHNFQIFELAGDAEAPEPGEELFGVPDGAQLVTGPGEAVYSAEIEELAAGSQYYYNCIVHPAMQGLLTIGGEGEEGAEGAAAEGEG